MAMFFGIGLFELLVVAAILVFLAAPLVIAGAVIWVLLSRKASGNKD